MSLKLNESLINFNEILRDTDLLYAKILSFEERIRLSYPKLNGYELITYDIQLIRTLLDDLYKIKSSNDISWLTRIHFNDVYRIGLNFSISSERYGREEYNICYNYFLSSIDEFTMKYYKYFI